MLEPPLQTFCFLSSSVLPALTCSQLGYFCAIHSKPSTRIHMLMEQTCYRNESIQQQPVPACATQRPRLYHLDTLHTCISFSGGPVCVDALKLKRDLNLRHLFRYLTSDTPPPRQCYDGAFLAWEVGTVLCRWQVSMLSLSLFFSVSLVAPGDSGICTVPCAGGMTAQMLRMGSLSVWAPIYANSAI